jgi:hypothetical protein
MTNNLYPVPFYYRGLGDVTKKKFRCRRGWQIFNIERERLSSEICRPTHAIIINKTIVNVPHSGSGVAPMSSLSGVELLGLWEFGMGGLIG